MFNLRVVTPDGQTMPSAEVQQYLQSGAGKQLAKKLDDAVGWFRCPVHEKQPTIIITLSADLQYAVSVTACCDAAQAEAARAVESCV